MQSNLVIVTLAWPTNQEGRLFSRTPHEPDMETVAHWVSRLEPIIKQNGDEEVIVVFANRSGSEDGVVYAGSSVVLGIKGGEVNVYGILGRSDRELLVVDTDKEPYGKLVYRQGPDAMPYLAPYENIQATPSRLSISEVVEPNDSADPLKSGMSTPARNQPKLSLKTKTEDLEPPFPSVVTPTGPSPTPFSRRPRISIPPAESWTQRYVDAHMKSPAPHPMALSPPPVQIFGGEVTIMQSPLYSATGGPPMSPWAIPDPSKQESPTSSGSTIFTGLSPVTGVMSPFQFGDTQSGSNASARRQQPVQQAVSAIDGLVASHVVTKPTTFSLTSLRPNVPSNQRVEMGKSPGLRKCNSPATTFQSIEKAHPQASNYQRSSPKQPAKPSVSPPPLLPLTYAPPKVQRIEDLTQKKPVPFRSPSCHESPRRERGTNTAGGSKTRFRSESRGGAERGRSTGARVPVASRTTTPAMNREQSRTTTPPKNREQSRGRSRTNKHEKAPEPSRPPSRQKSRSNSSKPIDLSKFQVIEERPCPNCTIHGVRSRSASQDQPSPRAHDSTEPHNLARPASARRQRPNLRPTPVRSNWNSNLKDTPPSSKRFGTPLSAAALAASPIGPLKPLSPAKNDQQSKAMVKYSSPPGSGASDPGTPHPAKGTAAFHFAFNPERKLWIETWLPTQPVSSYAKSTPSPQASPKTPINDPTTPRAMVTAPESKGGGNVTISFVKTLESMVQAPEFTRAW